MAKKSNEENGKKSEKRTRHSARKWIVQALESADASVRMRTSEIQAKASKLAGSPLPGYSIYQALRTLTKREVVAAKREGREFTYQLKSRLPKRGRPPAASAAAPSAPTSTPAAAPAAVVAPEAPTPVVTSTTSLTVVHKLAPGEIAILHVGEKHVEAASNVHGKLVLEKHKRPS